MNSPAEWSQYKKEFAWDGSLRDVYILKTGTAEWQAFLEFVRSAVYPSRFTIDGHLAPLPGDVREIFSSWPDHHPLLILEIGGVPLCCHFFSEDEIEFDLDPRTVTGEEKAETLFEFMGSLGRILGLRVRMTPENMRGKPIFEYDPGAGRWSYHSHEEDVQMKWRRRGAQGPMNTNRITTTGFSNRESERLFGRWPSEPSLLRQYEEGSQCGGCSFYAAFNADFGLCCHSCSRHFTETVLEHFTCSSYVHEGWGPHSFTTETACHCKCHGWPAYELIDFLLALLQEREGLNDDEIRSHLRVLRKYVEDKKKA